MADSNARSRASRLLLLVLAIAALLAAPSSAQRANAIINKEVDFAPEAELVNGNDDIDPAGNCQPELERFCKDVTAGNGAFADCISDEIAEAERPEGTEHETGSISDSCREEVYQFKIVRNENINRNVPLAKACKVDAAKYCNITWFFGYKSGQVISCLRDVKDRLAPACKKQVFKVQQEAAEDFRADAQLHEACKDDAATLCKDVKVGGGRVQGCLRDERMRLSWACEEQLFRQEMENADDIRLSARLFTKCLPDKKRFCADVPPGNAKAKDCLEEHRNDEQFSEECKAELDSMIERRVRDFRLDSRLRSVCEADIYSMCAFFGDMDTMDSEDASVIRCLQDYSSEIKSDACKKQVVKYQQLAAEDIRFDVPLADACYEDRQKLCGSVPPGSARVIRCLTTQRDKLSGKCRAVMFDEEMRFSANIDFQYPMKTSCKREMSEYCKDIPHGEARVIRCLQDNKDKKDFGRECRSAVKEYEAEASSDYRLNHRLSTACKNDIGALCRDVCSPEDGQICGGRVLRCLTEKREEIQSEACQKEVHYFEKMEVTDYRNDVILAAACRTDVETYCAKVEPGDGRVHACLRENRKKISDACRAEELLLESQEAESVELRPGLMKSCADERNVFCKNVAPGSARVFRCLAEKMGDADFGDACRGEIINKLQRRQANWKLDPPLRKACRDAVKEHCLAEDKLNGETGAVYKCLISHLDDLDTGCSKEVGRAIHMAFYAWQPGAILTSNCDDDVAALCLGPRPNMAKTPGAIGQCLAALVAEPFTASGGSLTSKISPGRRSLLEALEITDFASGSFQSQNFIASRNLLDADDDSVESLAAAADAAAAAKTVLGGGATAMLNAERRPLSDKCRALAEVAEPPNTRQQFEAGLAVALLAQQLSMLESSTGVSLLDRNRRGQVRGIALTGWTALAGIAAMVVLIGFGLTFGYNKYRGTSERDYSLIVKGRR